MDPMGDLTEAQAMEMQRQQDVEQAIAAQQLAAQ